MEKVQGVGGLFIRSQDPKALAKWYDEVLGINPVPTDAETPPWMQEAGPTVFSPFAADTDYFRADRQVMMNFRVGDIDAMSAQIEAFGTSVKRLPDMEGIGKFAHLEDPEGNPIELWEPAQT